MGSFRNSNFDAVIGIGGKKPWKGSEGIAYKLTWVGIHPEKSSVKEGKRCSSTEKSFRGQIVGFRHFCCMNEKGPKLEDCAPKLAKYMFEKKIRLALSQNLPIYLQKEIGNLVKTYKNKICPPSEKCQCGQS
ncbi:MAG: hypothetical protein ACR2NQ_03095 [Thermodesulfobacteriota bacterium]